MLISERQGDATAGDRSWGGVSLLSGDVDGSKMEHERLGVGSVSNVSDVGGVGLASENKGHKFLARFEAAGIAARRRRGEMLRKDGGGEELTTRKGAHVCVAELGGEDGMDSGLVNKGRVMSAAYSGCAGIRSGCGNGEGVGLSGASRTESMSGVVLTRVGRDKSMSTVSSGGDGVWRALRY